MKTIEFRAFQASLHAGEIKSYIQLAMAISHQALKSSAASARRPLRGVRRAHRCPGQQA